jgi:hypothetical protein
MDNGAEPPVFVVRQYVYNCVVLDANDINVIISASKKLIVDGVYTDPFEEDGTKHAIIYREKTNEPPKDVTAKTLKKHRAAKKKREQHTDNNQELNTEQYMNKKLIRLTESDLHRIVKESVNRILSEIDLIPNQSGGMRIADLKEFDFYIGNTRAGSDVVASNEGIFVDDELVNTYDPNVVINEPHDLIEAIDDAISFCPSKYIRKRDRDELGCYLGASLSIKDWWKENYG